MKKLFMQLILLMLLIFSLTSCAFVQTSTTKIKIVTTLFPEYDMVTRIIGDNKETQNLFDVTMIVRPGQDSHTYDPSINDLIIIKNADLFIYTADEMETWVNDLDFSSKTKVLNLAKSEKIDLLEVDEKDEHVHTEDEDPSHEHTHVHSYDPHYWTYPIYASYMVEEIKNAICSIIEDPYFTYSKVFETNASNYIAELIRIDENIKMIVENAANKTMYFGSPFSFYYWAYYYDLDYVLTYSTCSTETEPSIDVLENIISEMKKHNIKVIFSKELINHEACETIALHTGAQILELHSGHNINVIEFNQKSLSFLDIMKKNVINLSIMLQVDESITEDLRKEYENDITM